MSDPRTPLSHWEGVSIAELQRTWAVPLLVLESTASTNDDARTLAQEGAPSWTTVIADQQTSGRGQHGRSWHALPGQSLLFSIVLRQQPRAGDAPQVLPLRVGLAVAAALQACGLDSAQIKWPNDLIVAGRKLGGILCEGASTSREAVYVAGIGINVLQQRDDWPPELAALATSVAEHAHPPGRAVLAGEILRQLRVHGHRLLAPLDPAELAAWARLDALAGRAITIDGEEAGAAGGISALGALRVVTAAGDRHIHSGTVRLSGDAIS